MIKTSENTEFSIWSEEGVVKVDNDSRAGYNGNKFDGSEINNGKVGGGEIDDEVGKKSQKTSKSKNLFKSKKLSKSKKAVRSLNFLTPGAKLAFTKLRQVFFKAPILHHFDPECHI